MLNVAHAADARARSGSRAPKTLNLEKRESLSDVTEINRSGHGFPSALPVIEVILRGRPEGNCITSVDYSVGGVKSDVCAAEIFLDRARASRVIKTTALHAFFSITTATRNAYTRLTR